MSHVCTKLRMQEQDLGDISQWYENISSIFIKHGKLMINDGKLRIIRKEIEKKIKDTVIPLYKLMTVCSLESVRSSGTLILKNCHSNGDLQRRAKEIMIAMELLLYTINSCLFFLSGAAEKGCARGLRSGSSLDRGNKDRQPHSAQELDAASKLQTSQRSHWIFHAILS